MRSSFSKDFMQGQDNNRASAALEQLRLTDPVKYEEYMRLKMKQSWEEAHGGPVAMPEESAEPQPKKKNKPKRHPKIAEQIASTLRNQ